MKPIAKPYYLVQVESIHSDPRRGACFHDPDMAASFQRSVLALGRSAQLLKLEAVQ